MRIDFLFVCAEKWEGMKVNESGAFCSTCKTQVEDFTSKNKRELKSEISIQKDGAEFCGRFKAEQLFDINFKDFFRRFTLWNLKRRIAVVMFFVLGGMLFSCVPIDPAVLFIKDTRYAGAMAMNDTIQPPSDSCCHQNNFTGK
jgi:hypothetical protein